MKEIFDFRLFEAEARPFFQNEGQVLSSGLARALRASPGDDVFSRLRLVHSTLRAEGRHLIASWGCIRRYSKKEVDAASWFVGLPVRAFEPTGEECGTVYDDSSACEVCGFGAAQISPLHLDLGKIPKGVDIARTIAGEIVVSDRFAELVHEEGITGAEIREVLPTKRRRASLPRWHQLTPKTADVEVARPTSFGVDPFSLDEDGRYRCPTGHVLGLRRLSVLSVSGDSLRNADLQATRAAVGQRLGELRPERILVLSRRLHAAINRARLKGLDFEVINVSVAKGETSPTLNGARGL